MSQLRVFRAKPNPLGKDRNSLGIPLVQLASEWIDIVNVGTLPATLTGLQVWNLAYSNLLPRWQMVCTFSTLILRPGEAVRLHSGEAIPLHMLKPEDRNGVNYHHFTNVKRYVWNNKLQDKPRLYNPRSKMNVDLTKYLAPVPNGKVLNRRGEVLV